ncbi:Por secretion system C-terminal sorting domain-containing protein [Formosa sp. Hel1_31_208]|uniref:VPS10 domain-containing protein n=1 Tax=Formosa sp. Hel1_31_208 TaxID=1798225 RepID=UPI0008792149|nr:T9SS type A sorting domain-containing protein [Formosa sp. Hel1_31_208]SDS71935.1 Por secretion system C-terminal sorting domain-containing protein [Formosa sp. Hel1_31_208]
MKNFYLLLAFLFSFTVVWSQDYRQMIAQGTYTVAEIQTAAEAHFALVGTERGRGYKPYKRWEYQALRNMDENGMLKSPEFYFNELEAYNSYLNESTTLARTTVGSWEELGPVYWNQSSGWNPGVGRITAIAAESGNSDHMIVGANSGGVWKTLDGGVTWDVLTDDLSNLVVYALAIDPTNASIYYWGTTSGTIFKSVDAGATWSLLADTGNGNVNKILIDPTDTSKMYCSVEGGGIFKSTDTGATWTRITSSATNGYDIEFKPGDTNVIYASGTSFFKSTDGGTTFTSPNGLGSWTQEFVSGTNDWTTSGSNQNNSVTPRTGSGMALFYIGNFSEPTTNLITPALDLTGASSPTVSFSYTNVNWAGDIDTVRVLYKTSAGGSWIELAEYTSESATWNDITLALPNPSSDYYVAFEGTSFYGRGLTLDDVSINDATLGTVFEDGFETSPNTFAGGPKMIGVSPANPDVVYVLEAQNGTFAGFHRSDNSGNTFTELDHNNKNYFGYDTNANDNLGQAPRDMDIAINPTNIDDVHIAGINTWRSTDGGTTFGITSQWVPGNAASLNIGYCHADVDILEFIEGKLYAGTDGGVYVADNPTTVNSTFYRDLTTGLGIRQFYKIGISQTDPVIVTGGSQDNGTSVRAADGVWSDWLGADGMESFVDKNDSNILYGTSQFGSLYKTFNGGANYTGLPEPDGKSGNWITPFEQDPITPNTIYTGYDEVYKSVNGGTFWTSISQNFGGDLNHLKIAPSNSNVMYAADGNRMFKNTNADVNTVWTEIPGILGNINSIAVHPSDPAKVAIATTDGRKVFVSTNGGDNWTSYQLNLPNFNAQALVWHDNGFDGLYLGMNYGVYYIDNTYTEWQPFSNGLPNVIISELEINTVDEKVYAATYGRGLWRSDLFDDTLSLSEFDLESFNMYPNPTNKNVTLSWDKTEKVSIRIFDTQGKLMYFAKNQTIAQPKTIDVSNYATGLYFVKINNSRGFVTKKLVIE